MSVGASRVARMVAQGSAGAGAVPAPGALKPLWRSCP